MQRLPIVGSRFFLYLYRGQRMPQTAFTDYTQARNPTRITKRTHTIKQRCRGKRNNLCLGTA